MINRKNILYEISAKILKKLRKISFSMLLLLKKVGLYLKKGFGRIFRKLAKIFLPKKSTRHLTFEFIKVFLLLLMSFFMIIFVITFIDFSGRFQRYSVTPITALKIVTYRIPQTLEVIIVFLIILATTITLMKLYSNNEITIFYGGGYSSWNIPIILATISFIIGLLNITFFNKLAIKLYKNADDIFTVIKGKNIKKDNYLKSSGGIWLNFRNGVNGENYIIKTHDVFVDTLIFRNILILVLGAEGDFIHRIRADSMKITSRGMELRQVTTAELNRDLKKDAKLFIELDMDEDFLRDELQNRYSNINHIPFMELGGLIAHYRRLNLDVRRFLVKWYNFLLTPYLYSLLALATFIIIKNNPRGGQTATSLLKIIMMSIATYFLQNILLELAMVNRINPLFILYFLLILSLLVLGGLIKKLEL